MQQIEKILMSSCLVGLPVRYDGRSVPVEYAILDQWKAENRIIAVCPEVAGGLPIPRPSAEIKGSGGGSAVLDGNAVVETNLGNDVTTHFIKGAQIALETAQKWKIKIAILKENSPSCGSSFTYDGTFSKKKLQLPGVTAALLRKHGIQVFSEHEIDLAQAALSQLELI